MSRATMTTRVVTRPANLYASLPAVEDKPETPEEAQRVIDRARRANDRRLAEIAAEEARVQRNNKIAIYAVGALLMITLGFVLGMLAAPV